MKFELVGKKFDNFFDSAFEQANKAFQSFDKMFSEMRESVSKINDENEISPVFENIVETNLKEENDKFILTIPCKNAKKEDVNVTVKNDKVKLKIQYERKNEDGSVHSFSSIVERTIPNNVDKGKIKANIKNNSLILTMPKLSEDK